jgi:hypothetical protein
VGFFMVAIKCKVPYNIVFYRKDNIMKKESIIEITPARAMVEVVKQSKCRDISSEFDRLVSRLLAHMNTVSECGESMLTIGLTENDYTVKYAGYDRARTANWEYSYLNKLRDNELHRIVTKLYDSFCAVGYTVEDVTGLPADTINVGVVLQISWGGDIDEAPIEPWYSNLFKFFRR